MSHDDGRRHRLTVEGARDGLTIKARCPICGPVTGVWINGRWQCPKYAAEESMLRIYEKADRARRLADERYWSDTV